MKKLKTYKRVLPLIEKIKSRLLTKNFYNSLENYKYNKTIHTLWN